MNNKELKEYWSNKTLGELKGYISERERVLNNMQDIIKEDAQSLIDLDITNKNYSNRLYELADKIKRYSKDIKDDMKDLEVLRPILEKKEIEGIDQAQYNKYMADNNDNIKVLIKTVEDDKQEFIASGGKIEIITKGGKAKVIYFTEEEINEMYDTMLKELIYMIKDNVGNIIEVNNLRGNGNRGFDCSIHGEKGNLNINTIVAGGEIQRIHFRTLLHKY